MIVHGKDGTVEIVGTDQVGAVFDEIAIAFLGGV
jgi:hypothetical protein